MDLRLEKSQMLQPEPAGKQDSTWNFISQEPIIGTDFSAMMDSPWQLTQLITALKP